MAKAPPSLAVVVPAAGVGKRMNANCPKQYLRINEQSILAHTIHRLASHPLINQIVIALSEDDAYFAETGLLEHPKVVCVVGGEERVDSVLAGLNSLTEQQFPWVLVHDAARPCLAYDDLNRLIETCLTSEKGGLLAVPVKDTMKRGTQENVIKTVERENLWHALTPQMYPTSELKNAIEQAIQAGVHITDESSAIEYVGGVSQLIESSSENIKITRPDDLALAEFILHKQSLNKSSRNKT